MTRVLLTNDDGVESAGLSAMTAAMREAGHDVVVVAPSGNRSAMGHRVTVRETITLELLRSEAGLEVWSCSGTPADCVRVAFFAERIAPFDMVFSGINHGVNLGEDVFYSGTFAAAVEAAFLGVPSVASSQAGAQADAGFLSEHPTEFPHAHYLASLASSAASFWPEGLVLNLNFPGALADTAVRACALGKRHWATSAMQIENGPKHATVTHAWAQDPAPFDEPDTDFSLLTRGYTTVTPVQVRGGLQSDIEQWAQLVRAGVPATIGEPRHA